LVEEIQLPARLGPWLAGVILPPAPIGGKNPASQPEKR
jgi:hypothetical protein